METVAAQPREAALARWRHLTTVLLPGLATAQQWPIRLDHCFMRVCLDVAIGAPWHQRVRRPAIRNVTDEQLAAAIAVAERVAAQPSLLPALNRQSLILRGKLAGARYRGGPTPSTGN